MTSNVHRFPERYHHIHSLCYAKDTIPLQFPPFAAPTPAINPFFQIGPFITNFERHLDLDLASEERERALEQSIEQTQTRTLSCVLYRTAPVVMS